MNFSKLHIVAVTGIVVKGGKFLIVKRSEKEIAFPGKWTVPGGKLEAPDNCRQTLKREILEEVGIKIQNEIIYLRDYEFTRPDNLHVIGITFLCKYKSGKVKLDQDFTDYAWVTLKEAKKYDLILGAYKDLKLANHWLNEIR